MWPAGRLYVCNFVLQLLSAGADQRRHHQRPEEPVPDCAIYDLGDVAVRKEDWSWPGPVVGELPRRVPISSTCSKLLVDIQAGTDRLITSTSAGWLAGPPAAAMYMDKRVLNCSPTPAALRCRQR